MCMHFNVLNFGLLNFQSNSLIWKVTRPNAVLPKLLHYPYQQIPYLWCISGYGEETDDKRRQTKQVWKAQWANPAHLDEYVSMLVVNSWTILLLLPNYVHCGWNWNYTCASDRHFGWWFARWRLIGWLQCCSRTPVASFMISRLTHWHCWSVKCCALNFRSFQVI